VHMNQVHKETLTSVDNALGNRASLDVEIFGMEGIPDDVVQAHNQRIITQFYQAEADRRAASGNHGPGGAGGGASKKPKFESPAELKKRLAEHKAKKAQEAAGGGSSGGNTPAGGMNNSQSPAPGHSPAFVSSPLMFYSTTLTCGIEWFPICTTSSSLQCSSRCKLRLILTRTICAAGSSLSTTVQPAARIYSAYSSIPTSTTILCASILSTSTSVLSTGLPTATQFPRRSSLWRRNSSRI
jgi:hypothetical protein